MASGSTSRLAIPYPLSTDPTNIPGDALSLASRLDAIIASFAAGTFASRPAAGTQGRIYFATDTGVAYWDTGSAWVSFQPTLAELQAILGLSAVGDLPVMGPSGLARLPVGSNGQVLTARSTATDGVDWESAFPAASSSWSPSVSSWVSSVGNGSVAGSYVELGALIFMCFAFVAGSTTTYRSATGVTVPPPVAAGSPGGVPIVGAYYVNSVGTALPAVYFASSGNFEAMESSSDAAMTLLETSALSTSSVVYAAGFYQAA